MKVVQTGGTRLRAIGRSVRAPDWDERTAGRAVYASDVVLPDMLFAAVLRSPHPFARIVNLDTRPALALTGVHAAVTGRDFPPERTYIHFGPGFADRPPLARDVVRFIGQEVAAVAAEDPRTAVEAVRRMRVKYRPMRAPTTIDQSLRFGARRLHRREAGQNLALDARMEWGEMQAAFDEAAIVGRAVYRHPQVTHITMEPDATVAWWRADRGCLEVWSATQAPYFVRKELAHVLDLEVEQILFHPVAVGGGFGARSKICDSDAIAAVLSMRSGRPVKSVLSREEQFATSKTRHQFRVDIALALDREQRLSGIEADLLVDNGAYNHNGPGVIRTGMKMLGMVYRPRGVRVRGRLVDTAKVPGGQFRGYGNLQTAFALESQIDELATVAGLDPLELRLRNATLPDQVTLSGARIGTAALVECLETVREAIGWDEKRRDREPGRGIGIATAIHGSGVHAYEGSNRSSARVEVHPDGHVRVFFGGGDAGTGQRTILLQIAAEALGVEPERVEIEMMDLRGDAPDHGAWSSRGTHFGGHAVRVAALEAAERLRHAARVALDDDDVWLDDGVFHSASGSIGLGELAGALPEATDGVFAWESTFEDLKVDSIGKLLEEGRASTSPSYAFAAHAVELEVDPDTGEVRILDYLAVHDSGQLINPVQAEGQVIGGVVMALGSALREELIFDRGRVVNPAFQHYGVPRAADVPPVRVRFVGEPEPLGPFGAKNIGELGSMPTAAAVANAIHHATGIRIRDLPITPDKLVSAGAAATLARSRTAVWRRPSRWWIAGMRWAYPKGLELALHRWGTRLSRRREVGEIEQLARPASEDAALDLAASGYTPIGAGTELRLLRQQELSSATRLVSLNGVDEYAALEPRPDGGFRIGGAVTLKELLAALGDELPAIGEAVRTIATPQIRAVASVAGNLLQDKRCWFYRNGFNCYKRGGPASPCYALDGDHRFYHATMEAHRCQAVTPSDLATVFAALDASAELTSRSGTRVVAVSDLYTGPGETCLRPGEVLRSIRVPGEAVGKRTAFDKLQLWAGDFAVAAVAIAAAVDEDHVWRDVRLVVGGVAPTPWLADAAGQRIDGCRATPGGVREALAEELWDSSHPLPMNAWKVHAATRLAERAAERISR